MEKINFTDPAFPFLRENSYGSFSLMDLPSGQGGRIETRFPITPGVNIGTLLSGLAMNAIITNKNITGSAPRETVAEASIQLAEALIDQINKKYSTDGREKYRRPLG